MRERLIVLTARLERAADELSADVRQGELGQADDAVAALRDAAEDTYRALGKNVAEDTHEQLEDAVRSLGG